MRKTENGQNTTIIVQASKINQEMLKLVGESLNRNMVFTSSHLQWRSPACISHRPFRAPEWLTAWEAEANPEFSLKSPLISVLRDRQQCQRFPLMEHRGNTALSCGHSQSLSGWPHAPYFVAPGISVFSQPGSPTRNNEKWGEILHTAELRRPPFIEATSQLLRTGLEEAVTKTEFMLLSHLSCL